MTWLAFACAPRHFFTKMLLGFLIRFFFHSEKKYINCKHCNQNNIYWVTTLLEHLQIIYKCQDCHLLSLICTNCPNSSKQQASLPHQKLLCSLPLFDGIFDATLSCHCYESGFHIKIV